MNLFFLQRVLRLTIFLMIAFAISVLLGILSPPIAEAKPENVMSILRVAAQKANVPFPLLYGICKVESNLNPLATNFRDGATNSHGLCQIKLATAREMGFTDAVKKLYNPLINATYAAHYLRFNMDRYSTIPEAVSAYNAGRAIIQNKSYVRKVLLHAKRQTIQDIKNNNKRFNQDQLPCVRRLPNYTGMGTNRGTNGFTKFVLCLASPWVGIVF